MESKSNLMEAYKESSQTEKNKIISEAIRTAFVYAAFSIPHKNSIKLHTKTFSVFLKDPFITLANLHQRKQLFVVNACNKLPFL